MAWKINFLPFFKFLPLFCNQWAWKPVKTIQHMKMPSCGHIQHHIWWFGTDFRLEIASSNRWNGLKNHFFTFFQISSTFWVPNDQIWCWIYPKEGIFMCWVVFTGFQVYWLPKSGRNLTKCKNDDFQAICTVFKVTSKYENLIQELNFGALWAPGGALEYAKLFPNVCWCFLGNKRGQKWLRPQNVICRCVPPYEIRPKRSLAVGTPRHQFFWTFYAFSSPTR